MNEACCGDGARRVGVSPYGTGGGGFTLERRVAVYYLTRLLAGGTALGLDDRRIESVAFQQAPTMPVDDIVIAAGHDGEAQVDLELAVAVRRSPQFVTSDNGTEKLFGKLIDALELEDPPGIKRRFAICVAGGRRAAQEVAELADLARGQSDAQGFHQLVEARDPAGRNLKARLDHLVNLVTANLPRAGHDKTPAEAQRLTWRLLEQVYVVMPRLESPDELDWVDLVNQLEPWARESTLAGARALRDRLEALAAEYAPQAAVVDRMKLCRDVHSVLNLDRRRLERAWGELRCLDTEARAAVRASIGVPEAGTPFELPREEAAAALRQRIATGRCLLVMGESGVGKSALVVRELSAAQQPILTPTAWCSSISAMLPPRCCVINDLKPDTIPESLHNPARVG